VLGLMTGSVGGGGRGRRVVLGLGRGWGPVSHARAGWRWLRRVSGWAHGAAMRHRATVVDLSEKEKARGGKKGRRAT
jgi:hypothetical protein